MASFQGLQTFAGPLGQQSIFGWPSGPAINIWLALWASNQYISGPLGQPQILCGQMPLIICCGLWPQLCKMISWQFVNNTAGWARPNQVKCGSTCDPIFPANLKKINKGFYFLIFVPKHFSPKKELYGTLWNAIRSYGTLLTFCSRLIKHNFLMGISVRFRNSSVLCGLWTGRKWSFGVKLNIHGNFR